MFLIMFYVLCLMFYVLSLYTKSVEATETTEKLQLFYHTSILEILPVSLNTSVSMLNGDEGEILENF